MIGSIRRKVEGVIAKSGIAIEYIVLVKPGRPYPNAALKVVFYRYSDSGHMPVVVPAILKSTSMSGTACEAPRLITKRHGLRDKWPQRMIAYYYAIGITTKFSTGCPILQIIFAVIFGHP
jgi:hypothetical protein